MELIILVDFKLKGSHRRISFGSKSNEEINISLASMKSIHNLMRLWIFVVVQTS